MLEIVDANDKPLLLQLYKDAKHLPHRFVMLIVQDSEEKILLWRNTKKKSQAQRRKQRHEKPIAWGLLYEYVRAGEARESTALRLLQKSLPALLQVNRIVEELPSMQDTPIRMEDTQFSAPFTAKNYMTFFHLILNKEEKKLLSKDLLWLDFDELQGLATHFADMLTPSTLQLIHSKHLHRLCAQDIREDLM